MDPEQHLPLRPVEFQILVSLTQREGHGYSILQELEAREGQAAAPGITTLYRALLRLEKEGLIARNQSSRPDLGNQRKRVYRLTPMGRVVAGAEVQRLRILLDVMGRATP